MTTPVDLAVDAVLVMMSEQPRSKQVAFLEEVSSRLDYEAGCVEDAIEDETAGEP